MKKKTIIILLVFIILFSLTGCSKINKKSKKAKEGTMFQQVVLNDTMNNVEVFQTIIPANWKYYIESKWDIISSDVPGLEIVKISNPDSTASITFVSQQGYVENAKYNEGINKDYYTTYLHYMDASSFLDYYVNNYYSGAKFNKNLDIDQKLLDQLKQYNEIQVDLGKRDAETINGVTPNVTVSVSDNGVSSSKKQYILGSNVLEGSTAVTSIKTNLYSSLSPLLSSEAINWKVPYTIIYQAEDQKTFDKYYDDYLFIVANSQFTVDYYAMIEYVSSAIVNAVTAEYAARSKASLDAMNNYIDSNYSSSSSVSTNEKVMEMWDDVINEVDKYQLEDGSTLKTSMFNETVAQNGNEIYIGDKSGIPIGFDEVTKLH